MRILFCHEGDWHMVDRTWTILADGSGLKLLHPRTMQYEIEGHEFFSHDGQWAFYDLQTPRSGQFWLAGVNIATGERIRYPLKREEWSVHYNQSHDGKLFSGDGGGPGSVANRTPLPERAPLNPPGNGMWMYLFTPQEVPSETLDVAGEKVRIGKLTSERLVNLSMHDYTLEPNGIFSPDNKWLVFRSNMSGQPHTYAVELKKSN
jgi:oligogalacturonide lyase